MGIYRNGYKRPYIYRVIRVNGDGSTEVLMYSVLNDFLFYDEISLVEYSLLPESLAKQRMDDLIEYVNNTYYENETPTINESYYNVFDIYSDDDCPSNIPDGVLPPEPEQQYVCLNSEIISNEDSVVGIKWGANIHEGLALQEIQVPIRIIDITNNVVLSEEIIVINKNEQFGYLSTINYNKSSANYTLRAVFNLVNNDVKFKDGIANGYCVYPQETISGLSTVKTVFIYIPIKE